jgi:P27 family predicted phage terminase small subunit
LVELRIMTDIDRSALAAYCSAWGRYVDAERQLEKHGLVIVAPSGFPIQSPYLAIANKAMEQMEKLLSHFGMSPSTRTKVQIGGSEEVDPVRDFQRRRAEIGRT